VATGMLDGAVHGSVDVPADQAVVRCAPAAARAEA
jgi:hypothetical protein